MHACYMRCAIELARAQLGRCAPNPAVGCVIVKDGHIVGKAATATGGRPHAEPQALAQAGAAARGADVYVTLEPCSHIGATGPCAAALIEAGVARVYIANQDPNPKVAGSGIAMLRDAGIKVEQGIEAQEAALLHEGFFRTMCDNRPLVSLKIACSLDSKIATQSGQSQWITGAQARDYGHGLRANHDAIATGIATVLADDPALTCRLPGREGDSPKRYVFDRSGRLPADARMQPCEQIASPLAQALAQMAADGITRLLVEAGPTLSTAFLQAGLVDWLYLFRAPILIGAGGYDAIGLLQEASLQNMPRLQRYEAYTLGTDTLDVYRVSALLA